MFFPNKPIETYSYVLVIVTFGVEHPINGKPLSTLEYHFDSAQFNLYGASAYKFDH